MRAVFFFSPHLRVLGKAKLHVPFSIGIHHPAMHRSVVRSSENIEFKRDMNSRC